LWQTRFIFSKGRGRPYWALSGKKKCVDNTDFLPLSLSGGQEETPFLTYTYWNILYDAREECQFRRFCVVAVVEVDGDGEAGLLGIPAFSRKILILVNCRFVC
jgi:hypothetical protein